MTGQIREEFVSFIKMERVRAVDIEQAMIEILMQLGLSLDDLHGQGYDGASTMAGEESGVQRRILNKQSKVLYTHCSGHSFNLVIAHACEKPSIRNCVSVTEAITLWIGHLRGKVCLSKYVESIYKVAQHIDLLCSMSVNSYWFTETNTMFTLGTVEPFRSRTVLRNCSSARSHCIPVQRRHAHA